MFTTWGFVQWAHDIATHLDVSPDRKEVTCSVGGECRTCGPVDGVITLKAEGVYSKITFRLNSTWQGASILPVSHLC